MNSRHAPITMRSHTSVAEAMPLPVLASRAAPGRRSTRLPRLSLIAVSAAVVWLSGCAVHPTPFTDAERVQTVREDRAAMFANQPPLAGPVTLQEALARAIRYNLDHRLKMMEEALAEKQLDLAV